MWLVIIVALNIVFGVDLLRGMWKYRPGSGRPPTSLAEWFTLFFREEVGRTALSCGALGLGVSIAYSVGLVGEPGLVRTAVRWHLGLSLAGAAAWGVTAYGMYLRRRLSAGQPAPRLFRSRIKLPPGSTLLKIADFLFTPATRDHVFHPIVADTQFEYLEALSKRQLGKARWIRIRGFMLFCWAGVKFLKHEFMDEFLGFFKLGK